MRERSAEGRRKAAERKRIARLGFVKALDSIAFDPIADVEARISIAARTSAPPATLDKLASTLAKLKRAKQGEPARSASYPTTPSSPVRQPTPRTPQVTQAVVAQPCEPGASFAQCAEHLVGPAKESPVAQTVGAGLPPGGTVAGPTHAVIEAITRRLKTMTLEELRDLESSINQVKPVQTQNTPTVVRVVPVKAEVGAMPESGLEKFCVNGVWITGKRVR